MRRIAFTEAEILQLKKERIEHQHPIVRRRMMALYMKAVGYRHKEICCELNISQVCLYEYLDLYLKDSMVSGTLATRENAICWMKIETLSSLTSRPILPEP